MTARYKNRGSSLLPLGLVALAVLIGFFLMNSKSVTVNKKVTEETSKPVAQNTNTSPAVGASSGPIGRNGLRAYAGPNKGEVTLEWQRFFLDGENFSIHYGTNSKEYPYLAKNIGYISTYTVKGLTPGTKYYFVVEGIRAGGVSAGWDGEVSMVAPSVSTPVVGTTGPVGRNLLTVKQGPKKGEVTLSWVRYFPDTEKYHIVYGIVPGKYIYGLLNAIDTTPQDNNYSHVIGSLSSGTRYYFALEPQRSGQAIYATTEVSIVAP